MFFKPDAVFSRQFHRYRKSLSPSMNLHAESFSLIIIHRRYFNMAHWYIGGISMSISLSVFVYNPEYGHQYVA